MRSAVGKLSGRQVHIFFQLHKDDSVFASFKRRKKATKKAVAKKSVTKAAAKAPKAKGAKKPAAKAAAKKKVKGATADWKALSASTLQRKTVKDLAGYLESNVRCNENTFSGLNVSTFFFVLWQD